MSGKRAVINGADRYRAEVLARALVECGYSVLCIGKNSEKIKKVIQDLNQQSPEAHLHEMIVPSDDLEGIQATTTQISQRIETVDLLVNYTEFSRVDLQKLFLFSRRCVLSMMNKGSGRIINVSASFGSRLKGHSTIPRLSRLAMLGLTHTMSAEFKRFGIKVLPVEFDDTSDHDSASLTSFFTNILSKTKASENKKYTTRLIKKSLFRLPSSLSGLPEKRHKDRQ